MGHSNLGKGIPGVGNSQTSAFRVVRRTGGTHTLVPGPNTIDGSKSRDPSNTGDVDFLQAGLVMGRITTGKKWAPSILGVLASAYTGVGTSVTSLNVGAAAATEIVRRIGTSGTFKITGPPSAAGTVATTTITFSAASTSTGIVTITDPNVNAIAGSFIQPTDGSETPTALIDDGEPIAVVDKYANNIDVEAGGRLLVGGPIDSSQIINWPSDTSLITWLKSQLNDPDRQGSLFIFDDALTGG